MKEFNSIEDILEFAINEEDKAVMFYNSLANTAKTDDMKKVFIEFAKEEMDHKSRLLKIRDDKDFDFTLVDVTDLKISDYIVKTTDNEEMEYEDALLLAMRKEKAAFNLYYALSKRSLNPIMKALFLSLAQDETKHKLKFETEYDSFILRDN